MKKFMKNRFLPFLCVFSFLISLLVVPAYAATFPDEYRDTGSVEDIESFFLGNYIVDGIDALVGLSQGILPEPQEVFWSYVNKQVNVVGPVDRVALDVNCRAYNSVFNNTMANNFCEHAQMMSERIATMTLAGIFFDVGYLTFEVARHPSSGLLRIYCPELDWWVTNSAGVYPYVDTNLTDSGGVHWLPFDTVYRDIANDTAKVHPIEYDVLTAVYADLLLDGVDCRIASVSNKYKCIVADDGETILGNSSGRPYCAMVSSDGGYALDQERPDAGTVVNGEKVDVIEGNQTNINLGDMTLTLPDGTINFIDQIVYDESTKTYHVESHDTYNYTTNNYYTWNYHINYTSITYIGQTEEYNKYYEVYYELPDGRSSADLTKEDLEQLNLAIDVIPYARAADDVAIKALYHFDGDTRDASFWNYTGKFQWNKGASITYMDAAVFDGALYLDETEHDFSFVLPRFLVDDTFVMQWRYYQSATAAPVTDSYVAFGTNKLIQFNGESLLDGSGNVLAEMPIGSWNEIAIMRKDAAAYVYLNGLVVGQFILGSIITNKLDFHFGNEQQTFKYFDEFRLVTDEVYPIGSSYTPTAVPFDTNLTLVVPDGDYVVADEWKEFVKSDKAVLSFDFTQGEFAEFDSTPSFYNGYPQLSYGQVFTMITDGSFGIDYEWTEDGLVITREEGSSGFVTSGMSGLCMSLSSTYNTTDTFRNGSYPNLLIYTGSGAYTWTYCNFTYKGHNDENYNYYSVNGPSLNLGCTPNNKTGSQGGNLVIYPLEDSITISRIELYVQEAVPADFSKYITHSAVSVMDPEQLRTPTLAVRTDLDITGYQIGGVRPSVPKKGQVWALVENQRITSIQIYNGQAWESCDGRIWTGERWIPASSYNIVTLQDMYDIVDATPDYEYIYTESGFWSWWQKSWNAFTEKFFNSVGSGGSSGMVPGNVQQSASSALSSLIEGIFGVIIEVLKSLIGAAQDLLSGIFGFLTDTVFGGVKDFFSSFDELISPFQSTVENEDGTVTTTSGLPEGIASFYSDLVAMYMALPVELRSVLFFGIGLLILLGVFKLVVA